MSVFNFLSFFKKDDKIFSQSENEFLINLFIKLGPQYDFVINQLKDGIIRSKRYSKETPSYVGFKLGVDLLNKYEVKKGGRQYIIEGIKVFNKKNNSWEDIKVKVVYGLLLGYSCNNVINFEPDLNLIDVKGHYIKYIGEEEFNNIKHFFSKEELKIINPSNVYIIHILGQNYYHIKDLEDGDFIGIDKNRKVYKITHDPLEVNLLDSTLIEILKN